MKTFAVTKSFSVGPKLIAFLAGDVAPEPGEHIEVNGKSWACDTVAVHRKGWRVSLCPTEDGIAERVREITADLERMHKRNLDAQARVKAWMEGNPPKACDVDRTALEYDFVSMVKAEMNRSPMEALYRACETCKGTEAARREIKRLEAMGVPKNMTHAKLSKFEPRNDTEKQQIAKVIAFAKMRRGFLALLGEDKGTGKTHCGVGVARLYRTARVLTQQELLNALRRTYRDDKAEDIVAACKAVECLVVDEMGLSTGGRDEFPTLHDILSHRYNQELTTVLIGNFNTKEELYEIIGTRMSDRLKECGYAVLIFAGESHRASKKETYYAEVDKTRG